MYKLCFGTFSTILFFFAAPGVRRKSFIGTLLKAVNEKYDTVEESGTVSKIMNGYGNLSPNIRDVFKHIACKEPDVRMAGLLNISKSIKNQFIPLIDSNKYTEFSKRGDKFNGRTFC